MQFFFVLLISFRGPALHYKKVVIIIITIFFF